MYDYKEELKINEIIIDSLESTETDLRAANYVINLYSDLCALNGKRLTELTNRIIELQNQLDQK